LEQASSIINLPEGSEMEEVLHVLIYEHRMINRMCILREGLTYQPLQGWSSTFRIVTGLTAQANNGTQLPFGTHSLKTIA